MRPQRQPNAWLKIGLWFVAEITLNLLGLDNLADYSEFLYEREKFTAILGPQITIIAPPV